MLYFAFLLGCVALGTIGLATNKPAIISGSTSAVKAPKEETPKTVTRVLAWGANNAGQLGNGLKSQGAILPLWSTEVEDILKPNYSILEIDGGIYTSCLLRSDETVWCWGGGNTGNTKTPPPKIEQIKTLPKIKKLMMGSGYTDCAQAKDNSIWCWWGADIAGPTSFGEWDAGSNAINYAELKASFVFLYPGMHDKCAITKEGEIWCWGKTYNNDGRVHSFKQTDKSLFPVKVPLSKAAKEVNVGKGKACAILEDQSSWCWNSSLTPTPYPLLNEAAVKNLSLYGNIACALKSDKTIWCNELGGSSSTLDQIMISKGNPLNDIIKLEAPCSLRKDGSVWCWTKDGKSGAEKIKGPNGICALGNIKDIAVGTGSRYAVVKAPEEYFVKLESPSRSDEILAAIQAANFDKALALLPEAGCLDTTKELAEEALRTVIVEQRVDLLKALINAGIDLEMPHSENETALLIASSAFYRRSEVNVEIIQTLVDAGANPDAVGVHGYTPLSYLQLRPERFREAITIILASSQAKTDRTYYTHPPSSLLLEELSSEELGCIPGKTVFTVANKHSFTMPAGCSAAMAKVWGAGGGKSGGAGGTGGFSIGVINAAETKNIEVIVGGGGNSSKNGELGGKGGFNGGGNGGQGAKGFTSGGGGGGRSEILLDGENIMIAGGGGGGGRGAWGRGIPGGGLNANGFLEDYHTYVHTHEYIHNVSGKPGNNGIGGVSGDKHLNKGCIPPTAGSEKNGGDGAISLGKDKCGASGGGGGGSGHGGGGGGARDDGGGGGGGGGLAPDHGISLWGGLDKPANTNDPHYVSPHGQANQDGLIVISWPAPKPEALRAHLEKILPYQMAHRNEMQITPVSEPQLDSCIPMRVKNVADPEVDPYESYNDLPQIPRMSFRRNSTIERQIESSRKQFMRTSGGKEFIDKSVVVEKQTAGIKDAIRRQIATILEYDDNFDGTVTFKEIDDGAKARLIERGEDATEKNLARFGHIKKFDLNGDSIIPREEMIVLEDVNKQNIERKVANSMEHYLILDINQDGRLSLEEFEHLVKKAFITIDLNNDGIISEEERKAYLNCIKKRTN